MSFFIILIIVYLVWLLFLCRYFSKNTQHFASYYSISNLHSHTPLTTLCVNHFNHGPASDMALKKGSRQSIKIMVQNSYSLAPALMWLTTPIHLVAILLSGWILSFLKSWKNFLLQFIQKSASICVVCSHFSFTPDPLVTSENIVSFDKLLNKSSYLWSVRLFVQHLFDEKFHWIIF